MPNGAELTIVGNLTKDPELRFTSSGKAVCHFTVAVNRRTGQDKPDATSFFDCVAWEKLGDHVAQSLIKGERVIVQGRFESRTWEKEDGGKGSRWELTADAVGPDLRFKPLTTAVKIERPTAAAGAYGHPEDPF